MENNQKGQDALSRDMKLIRSIAQSPFSWFMVLMVALELFVYLILPYKNHPHASTVYRTPHPNRAWPEFTRAIDSNDKKLVVLISNSQALGREIRNPENIYFGLLSKELKNTGMPIVAENWSSGGMRTVDIELLTIRAAERKAALVIFVLGLRNFDPPSRLHLDFPPTDINLLAGEPSFWPYLSNTTFYPNIGLHDTFKRFLMLRVNLLRSRVFFIDSIAPYVPHKLRRYVIGHDLKGDEDDLLPVTKQEGEKRYVMKRSKLRTAERVATRSKLSRIITEEEIAERLSTFRRFQDMLQRRFSENNVRYIWVWPPLAAGVIPEETYENMESFNRQASELLTKSGVQVLNLTESIPISHFLTLTHLDEEGQERLSNLLLPVVSHELQ